MNECECMFHRYTAVHICPCGAVISHSQGDWDEHRLHIRDNPDGYETFNSYIYEHGDTAEDLRRKDAEDQQRKGR